MSSQIYNTDKYNFSKKILNGGRIPCYTNLSEIKTDFLKSGDSVLHLRLELKASYTLYSLTLESFCGIASMQKRQKLPANI